MRPPFLPAARPSFVLLRKRRSHGSVISGDGRVDSSWPLHWSRESYCEHFTFLKRSVRTTELSLPDQRRPSGRSLVPGRSAHGQASTCHGGPHLQCDVAPCHWWSSSTLPIIGAWPAPCHGVVTNGGALPRVLAPITLAALDGFCSSHLCSPATRRQPEAASSNSTVSISTAARVGRERLAFKAVCVGLRRGALHSASQRDCCC